MKKLLVLAVFFGSLAACGGGDGGTAGDPTGPGQPQPPGSPGPGTPQPNTVQLMAASFEPATLTVQRGTTVRWVNTSGIEHTITPQGHSQWTRVVTGTSTGTVLEVTFNTAGTFNYLCEPHAPSMSGQIIVQ